MRKNQEDCVVRMVMVVEGRNWGRELRISMACTFLPPVHEVLESRLESTPLSLPSAQE